MTTRRTNQRQPPRRPAPREWVIYGTWPTGKLASDAPKGMEDLAEFSWRLQAAVNRIGVRQLSDASGITVATIVALVRGDRRPHFLTMIALQEAANEILYFPGHGRRPR